MTTLARPTYRPGRFARLGRLVLNGMIGALLCTGPVTALIALGWLARRSGHLARDRFGMVDEAPGWLLGPRERGRMARAVGGLGANVRAGALALTALLAWTLPFTLLWMGAWWAGWQNSFNKGYEQAFVGPTAYFLGVFLAALVLPVLPLVFAHLAAEDRLSAAFELRRLRSLVVQAGWRLPALTILVAMLALPFSAARGLIATAAGWVPGFEDLPPEAIAALRNQFDLALGGLAFGSVWLIRSLAARLYASAAPRAAGLHPGLWDGAVAAKAPEPANARAVLTNVLWYAIAMAATLAFSFLVLAGQFLDHAWWRWVFHPLLNLPWAG